MKERNWFAEHARGVFPDEETKEEIWAEAQRISVMRKKAAKRLRIAGGSICAAAAMAAVTAALTLGGRGNLSLTASPQEEAVSVPKALSSGADVSEALGIKPAEGAAAAPGENKGDAKGAAAGSGESKGEAEVTAAAPGENKGEAERAAASSAEDYYTVLLAGVDGRGNGEDLQYLSDERLTSQAADILILCSIHKKTGKITLVNINRLSMMKLFGPETWIPANMAFHEGGDRPEETMLSMVNYNLDLAVTDIIAADFSFVEKAVNSVGGIMLDISDSEISSGTITGLLTESVDCTGIGTDGQFEKGGLQLCDGPKALAYIRNRFNVDSREDGGAKERGRRAAEVISKVREKLMAMGPEEALSVIRSCLSGSATNLTPERIIELAALMLTNREEAVLVHYPQSCRFFSYEDPAAETNDPAGMTRPKARQVMTADDPEEEVKAVHLALYGEEGYTPTAALKEIISELGEIVD